MYDFAPHLDLRLFLQHGLILQQLDSLECILDPGMYILDNASKDVGLNTVKVAWYIRL